MFFEKRFVIYLGAIWIWTLILVYHMGALNATHRCTLSHLDRTLDTLDGIDYQPPPLSEDDSLRVAEVVAIDLEVDLSLAQQIVDLVGHETGKYDIDPWLVLGLIKVESHGNPNAVSSAGAIGLMQLMPQTGADIAAELGLSYAPEDLYDLGINIRFGTYYLAQLFDRFDDPQAAIAAYNWGPNHISRRLAKGSTLPQVYPERVLVAARLAMR